MHRFLVVGDTALAHRVVHALDRQGHEVTQLPEPSDDDLANVLSADTDAVAVLMRADVAALRYALAIAHLMPDVRIVVTIFDRTVGEELRRLLPRVVVTSAAEVGSPLLAGPCLSAHLATIERDADGWHGLVSAEGSLRAFVRLDRASTFRRLRAAVACSPWSLIESGERMLILGASGLLGAMVLEIIWARTVHGWSMAHAFYTATRVVATVGPGDDGSGWAYWISAGLAMLLTVGFTAMFVAGLVDRLVRPSLRSAVGRRSVPRSRHVIVVGLGQVGLKLCRDLQSLGVPVVGVERDVHATNLRFARAEKIPVVVGHGEDRTLLVSLRLDKARAVAAVSSEDLDNVAVAVAAHAVAAGISVVLRAGEQEAVAETRSLLPLGITRDVTAATAAFVCAALRASDATTVMQVGDRVGVWTLEGDFREWLPSRGAM